MLIIDMPKLISVDKKLNVIESYENKKEYNLTTSNVCDIFKVSRKSIYNWRKKSSKNLPLKIKKWNKISVVTPEREQFIVNKTINNPKFNANKLVNKVNKKFNIKIKRNKIYQVLKKNNITHKKAYTVIVKNKKKHMKDIEDKKKEVNKDADETKIY